MWMKHFIKHVQPSKESKCLLLLDGHSSHTKKLEAIKLTCECGVVMLSFPPHTTHRMQPLDVGFFKPLKTAYNRSVETWMKSHSYKRAASVYQVSRFVGEAYLKAATMETAISGFRATGLWPPNRHVFDEELSRSTPPASAMSPPPASAMSPPPASAMSPQPASAMSHPPVSAMSPPPASAMSPPPASAMSHPPVSAMSPPPPNINFT